MPPRFQLVLGIFVTGTLLLLAGTAPPVAAGGAKKKTDLPAVTKGTLFTFEDDKGEVTSLGVFNMDPKSKKFEKIETFQVNIATKFILVEGSKKPLVFTPRSVLLDAKAKSGFQKENAITVEHKGNVALNVMFAPKKGDK